MSSPASSSAEQKDVQAKTAFAAWGGFAGAVVGMVIGAIAGHWLTLALILGILGYIIGALIDRSRR